MIPKVCDDEEVEIEVEKVVARLRKAETSPPQHGDASTAYHSLLPFISGVAERSDLLFGPHWRH